MTGSAQSEQRIASERAPVYLSHEGPERLLERVFCHVAWSGSSLRFGMFRCEVWKTTRSAVAVIPGVRATATEVGASAWGDPRRLGWMPSCRAEFLGT
jgi:hypothetical protein